MSDRTALILGAMIVGTFALDFWVFDTGATLFLLRKLTQLVEYLAFWR